MLQYLNFSNFRFLNSSIFDMFDIRIFFCLMYFQFCNFNFNFSSFDFEIIWTCVNLCLIKSKNSRWWRIGDQYFHVWIHALINNKVQTMLTKYSNSKKTERPPTSKRRLLKKYRVGLKKVLYVNSLLFLWSISSWCIVMSLGLKLLCL